MNTRIRQWLTLFLLSLSLAACSYRSALLPCGYRPHSGDCYRAPNASQDTDLAAASRAAVDALLAQAKPPLKPEYVILVTSLADLNQLEQSSPLGRLLAELLSTRLTQRGYAVADARARNDLLVLQDNGEFVLSRQMDSIRREHSAPVALAGTYVVAENTAHVTVKFIQLDGGVVLAAQHFSLPLGPDTQALAARR
jgi:TolB-like protein